MRIRTGMLIKFNKGRTESFVSKNGTELTRIYLPEDNDIDFGRDSSGIDRNKRKAYLMVESNAVKTDRTNEDMRYCYINPNNVRVYFSSLKHNEIYDSPESFLIESKRIKKLFGQIDSKIIDRIKQHISIIDLADEYFGVRRTGNSYSLINGNGMTDFSSLKLFPDTNTFQYFAKDKGGNVIDFVLDTHIENITTYKDAVSFLAKKIDPNINIEIREYKKQLPMYMLNDDEKKERRNQYHQNIKNNFLINHKDNMAIIDSDTEQVKKYLVEERHLDPSIVEYEISNKRIMQCITKNGSLAVAFIGYRQFNKDLPDVVSLRSIGNGSKFRGNISGSNMEEGFIVNCPHKFDENYHGHVYCFEAYIDMLSYMTLKKMKRIDYTNDVFITCSSTKNYKSVINYFNDSIWNRTKQLYQGNEQMTKKIDKTIPDYLTICFDNDESGRLYASKLKNELSNLKPDINIDFDFSYTKDWNEDLVKLTTDLGYEREKIKTEIMEAFRNEEQIVDEGIEL